MTESEQSQNEQPRNVSAEQFNALEGKVDSFADKFEKFMNSQTTPQTPPTPVQPPKPTEPPTPNEPTELGGFNLEQIKALAAEHTANVEQGRKDAITSAAKEAGIELNDGITKMILGSSKTEDDIKTNVEALAGLQKPKSSPNDPGFAPNGDKTAAGMFGDVLDKTFGKTDKE